MKGILPVSSKHHRDAYRKFLRPGTLAALRDSRICSRFHHNRLPSSSLRLHKAADAVRASDLSDPASSGDVTSQIVDRIPVFDCYGPAPRCGRRKRLFAARSVLLLSLEGRPPTPTTTRDSNGNVSASLIVGGGGGSTNDVVLAS